MTDTSETVTESAPLAATPGGTHHKFLEKKRNLLLSRLLRTVDELDHRRDAVVGAAEDAKQAVVPVGVGIAGLSVVAIVSYFYASHRARVRARANPLLMLAGAVRRAREPRGPSPAVHALTRLATGVLLTAATELAKYGLREVLASREERQRNALAAANVT